MKQLTQKKSTSLVFFMTTLCSFALFSVGIYGQPQAPSDNYYNENIGGQAPALNLPSQEYYNNNLRVGEWDEDDGPGGSGEGGNQGVGVPVGEGGATSFITCFIIYAIYTYTKKKNRLIRFKNI